MHHFSRLAILPVLLAMLSACDSSDDNDNDMAPDTAVVRDRSG